MKKVFSLVLLLMLFFVLIGCTTNSNDVKTNIHSFKGKIVEIHSDDSFIVEAKNYLTDKIIVNTNGKITWEVDTIVVVVYDGLWLDSDPPQVIASDIWIYNENNKNDIISIEVKKDTASSKEVTLLLTNHRNHEFMYGEAFYVEQRKNGNWVKVEGMPEDFILIGYILPARETVEITRNWGWKKELPAGHYRIHIGGVAAEFIIY